MRALLLHYLVGSSLAFHAHGVTRVCSSAAVLPAFTALADQTPNPWRRNPDLWKGPASWRRKRTSRERVTENTKKVKEAYTKAKQRSLLDSEWPVVGMILAAAWPWLVGKMLPFVSGSGDGFALALKVITTLQLKCSRLLVAAFCGAMIGIERGNAHSPISPILDTPAGLRTMTLVSSGAAVYVLACS